jgi:hypothetical protein
MVQIRGHLRLSPEARGVKDQLALILGEKLTKTPDWVLRARKLRMQYHYYGDWFWLNPHNYYKNREHYKNCWFLQPAHELFLLAIDLGLQRVTPAFLSALKSHQSYQDLVWEHCLAAAEAPMRKGAGDRLKSVSGMFGYYDQHVIELNPGWVQKALARPEDFLERRKIDLSALDKIIQDSVFLALGVDDSLVDHYDGIHRSQVILPHTSCVYVRITDAQPQVKRARQP